MTTRMTRKEFCGTVLSGTVLLLIQSCGGGSDNAGMSAPASAQPPSSGNASVGCSDTIAANHGHVLTVALSDLDSASDKTYNIQGSADHNHSVTLTVAQLRTLKTGTSVSTISSTTLSHQHEIVIACM